MEDGVIEVFADGGEVLTDPDAVDLVEAEGFDGIEGRGIEDAAPACDEAMTGGGCEERWGSESGVDLGEGADRAIVGDGEEGWGFG